MSDEEEDDELEKLEKEDRIRIGHLKSLIEHPGWHIIREIIEGQIRIRQDQIILKPTRDVADENFQKGEMAGLRSILAMPQQLVDDELEMRKQNVERTPEADTE